MQAIRPLEILTEYLLSGEKPEEEQLLMPIDIRTMYNI